MKAIITLEFTELTDEDKLRGILNDIEQYLASEFTPSLVETSIRGGRRVSAGAGGSKGEHILGLLRANPMWKREQVAELAGCSVSRVGEVMRAAGIVREKPGKSAESESMSNEAAGGAEPISTASEDVRHEKCEHEIRGKKRVGSCKLCASYVAA